MSLQKYLQTIKGIDPGKIYVENIRSLYNTSRYNARLILEMAVQEGILERKIGIICKNSDCQRVIASYNSLDEIPETITCSICESEEKDEYEFLTRDLEKVEFYKMKK